MEKNLNAKELYQKKKVKLAILGLFLSWISAVTLVVFQNFNVSATGIINESFSDSLVAAFVLTLVTLSLCEFVGGLIMIGYNSVTGVPFAEYGRLWRVKSSRTVLLSAVAAGPIATACSIVGISMCGSTYGNCIIGLTPIITAILGAIFLKEKTGARVFLGIAIAVVGIITATFAPPEGITNFYLGIIIVIFAPLGYSAEAVISTHAMDVSDPLMVCPLYRMIGSAIIEMICAVGLCAVTGNLSWIADAFSTIFSTPIVMIFLLLTAIFMAIQYNCIYVAYTYCGATRGSAILFSSPIWSIPVGLLMAKMGVLSYSVTTMGIIGAIIVVIGIVIVLAKPLELFKIRNV